MFPRFFRNMNELRFTDLCISVRAVEYLMQGCDSTGVMVRLILPVSG